MGGRGGTLVSVALWLPVHRQIIQSPWRILKAISVINHLAASELSNDSKRAARKLPLPEGLWEWIFIGSPRVLFFGGVGSIGVWTWASLGVGRPERPKQGEEIGRKGDTQNPNYRSGLVAN